MSEKEILFLPQEIRCPVRTEDSVLAVALRNGVEISHSCGGMGSCTTCRVFVEKCDEPLPPRTDLELDITSYREFAENERLSCQLPPLKGLVVRIPETLDASDLD